MPSCTHCGTELVSNGRFCHQCGNPLIGTAGFGLKPSPSVPQQRLETDKVFAARATLQGERKIIAILFADVKGSTTFIADLDPEDAESQLRFTVQILIDAVHRYGGTINRVQGDGIMALFGAPFADEESAVRASYAALEMQQNAQSNSPLKIRVGLHSGEVFLRAMHNDLSIDYEAQGLPVHLAARMEQIAQPGHVCCTDAFERLVRGFVETEALGPLDIKGLAEPLKVFRLLRQTRARSRWDIASGRNLTPFIGRDQELRELNAALKDTAEGHGRVVGITSEAGTGKSRLVYEFVRSLDVSSCAVIKASASLKSANTPYLLIGEALRSWCGLTDEAASEEVSRHLARKLEVLRETVSQYVQILQMLAGGTTEPAGWPGLEPSARRNLIITAVTETFLAAAEERPLLLWLEDLQWADSESLALLNTLTSRTASSRLLVVATYRPDRPALEKPHKLLNLASLESWAADMLLKALVGAHESTEELRAIVLHRAGGVPFFVEEIIRNLVESGELRGDPGAYELFREPNDLAIPDSVQAVIAARVDRLPAHLKVLLQAAAVLGNNFSFDRLKSLSATPAGEIRTALRDLESAHMLLESHSAGETRLEFVHTLTHEVVYGGLPLRTRQQLHGEAFKTLRQSSLSPLFEEELAHHAERAAFWPEAVALLRKTGTKALALSAYRDAQAFFERALRALGHLPETSSTVEEAVDIRLDLRGAFGATTGEYDRMRVCLDEAEVLASSINDRRRLGTVYVAQTLSFNLRGELDKSIERGELAKSLAKDTGDEKLELMARLYLAQAHMWRGNFQSVLDILEPSTGWIEGPLRHERMITTSTSSVLWQGMIAASHAYLGNFEAALRAGQEACAIAQENERPYDIVLSYWYVGFVHSHRGDFQSALRLLTEAFGLCTSNRLQFLYPVVCTSLGFAHAQAGAPEGIDLLSRAHTLVHSAKFYYAETWSSIYLGYAKVWTGRSQEALKLSQDALVLARKYGYRAAEAVALRLKGDAGLSLNGMKECEEAYLDSLAISTELMLRPDAARAKKALSSMYEASGQMQQAELFGRSAIQLNGELGLS